VSAGSTGTAVALTGALLVLAAMGCAPAREPPASPVGVEVTVLQYRRDQADGVVQLKARNLRDAAVTIDRVDLDVAAFRGVGPVRGRAHRDPWA
jgi:hypothetical protein